MAEFQWWLLIVGVVAGAALVGVITADARRERADVEGREREAMATWIAERLDQDGQAVEPALVDAVLAAQDEYLRLPPPDELLPGDAPALDR